jgi:hypothetical protein
MALEKLTELSVDVAVRRRGDAKLRTLRRRRRCSVDGEFTQIDEVTLRRRRRRPENSCVHKLSGG